MGGGGGGGGRQKKVVVGEEVGVAEKDSGGAGGSLQNMLVTAGVNCFSVIFVWVGG